MTESIPRQPAEGNSGLIGAVRADSVGTIGKLLRAGADVNARADDGFTVAMLAAHLGHARSLAALLEAGADHDARNPTGVTALLLAVHAGHVECIRLLLRSGSSPDVVTNDGTRPLHEAIRRCDPIATDILLAAGANPDAQDAMGRAPLHEASRLGCVSAVRSLLRNNADWGRVSDDDLAWPAWCFAKQAGHGRVLSELRRAGAAAVNASGSDPIGRGGPQVTWFTRVFLAQSALRTIEGVQVRVLPRASRGLLFRSIEAALACIQAVHPRLMVRLRKDIDVIWVSGAFLTAGGFDPRLRACLMSANQVLSVTEMPEVLAGLIVHEGVHARLWARNPAAKVRDYELSTFVRARVERMCCTVQHEFLVRAGAPSEIIQNTAAWMRVDPSYWSSREWSRRMKEMRAKRLPPWMRWLAHPR
jgi:hypothetical protein